MRADSAFTVIVPARLASARLADKPLADIGGRPMVVRVLERAAESGAAAVWAAVEDEALAMAVEDAGFRAIRTGAHDSGSARLAAAVEMLEMDDGEVVVNVQGDEPFMEPALIRAVAEALRDRPDCLCSTVCRKPRENAEVERPDVVKVVVDRDGAARYFSRQLIPYLRTGGVSSSVRVHLGLYAYRVGGLRQFSRWSPAPTEKDEQLEQLRFLWNGARIAVLEVESESFGVDTPEDLARAQRRADGR